MAANAAIEGFGRRWLTVCPALSQNSIAGVAAAQAEQQVSLSGSLLKETPDISERS
jgi:hypothetical protein